jgi:hypothetical protein
MIHIQLSAFHLKKDLQAICEFDDIVRLLMVLPPPNRLMSRTISSHETTIPAYAPIGTSDS